MRGHLKPAFLQLLLSRQMFATMRKPTISAAEGLTLSQMCGIFMVPQCMWNSPGMFFAGEATAFAAQWNATAVLYFTQTPR
jgi:enoyl-CoA hydratase/carnithine racemase